jgi:eukaryotic-like serine/threonine-protein kinase
MLRKLVVIAGPDLGRVYPLPEDDVLLLGRTRAAGDPLTDPYISRLHSRVEVNGDIAVVIDNDSAAGTFVNGHRLTAPHVLQIGDVIRIGRTELRLQPGGSEETATLPPIKQPAVAAVSDPLAQLAGQTISRYQIGAILARGQSGVVFHARDTEADLPVAFKVLSPRLTADATRRERFVRAMKTVLPLRHDNLIAVKAAGQTGGLCWIAMEYIEGESLTQWVQRAGVAGCLDWRHVLRVAIHLARALEYAHAQQIVHRNVTPMNVMVRTRDRVAKLGDLMLARALEGELAVNLSEPGEVLSDLNYIAPERTYPSQPLDERSDLFSLGATLYALLTGRPPFAGDTLLETIKKVRAAVMEPVRSYQRGVPESFEDIVRKLLAKQPEDRYTSATDALAALQRLAEN